MGLQKATRDSADSDPKFLLSDGSYGIGYEIRDNNGYHCRGVQGTMGNILARSTRGSRVLHQSFIFPEQLVLTIKPTEYWGSCYFAVDSGLISPVTYTQRINPQRGLWLEVYAESTNEKYLFNYISVEIHEN